MGRPLRLVGGRISQAHVVDDGVIVPRIERDNKAERMRFVPNIGISKATIGDRIRTVGYGALSDWSGSMIRRDATNVWYWSISRIQILGFCRQLGAIENEYAIVFKNSHRFSAILSCQNKIACSIGSRIEQPSRVIPACAKVLGPKLGPRSPRWCGATSLVCIGQVGRSSRASG